MQKLTSFYFFPIKQKKCLLYSNSSFLKSRLFSSLSIQISARESLQFKLRKTIFGHFLSKMLYVKRFKIKLEKESPFQIGYLSNDKLIFFGFNKENKPDKIYKQTPNNIWENTAFLGYTIIEKYTKEEYVLKRKFISKSLSKRWLEINQGKPLHGDFTHFNILLNSKEELHFIDQKELKNSKLYDHFYFYSYYVQCLERSKKVSRKDVLIIKKDLQEIIKKSCFFKDKEELYKELNLISVIDASGLTIKNKNKLLEEFKALF